MKKSIILVMLCLLLLINIGLGIYSFKTNKKLKELESNDNNITENNSNSNNDTNIKEIDCTFTQTYNIVDLMENYIAEVPEYSYIIVDKFQSHGAIAHFIPTTLKENLKVGERYEFTYHLKGKGDVSQILDIYDVIGLITIEHPNNDNLTATLKINKTDKLGLEQIQEPICTIQK